MRFLVSGTTAAAVNIFILFLLVEYVHIYYLVASVLSYLGSLVFGFTLQKFWAFRDYSTHRTHFQALGYVIVTATNLGFNTVLMYVLVSVLGVWYILAQFFAGAAMAVTSYFAYKTFVFTEEPETVS